jgi:hypothetical protein
MQFAASLFSVKVDKDGESTVVLKVPQSDLLEILKLTQYTEMLLNVNIEKGEVNE